MDLQVKTQMADGYSSLLSVYETQRAIGTLKRLFEDKLCANLSLYRVSAPLFVASNTGLNDDLNGVESPVSFEIDRVPDKAVVVHSLAKWKRMALHQYGFEMGTGIVTDMNAIRRNEIQDTIHSAYVDQWDWEKIIKLEDRSLDTLKATAQAIVNAVAETQAALKAMFPQLTSLSDIKTDIKFVTTQELEDLYPDAIRKERENLIAKEYGTVFIMGVGHKLKSGEAHDGRAPDYDDWNLNGDIVVWNETLQIGLELSSMGIRVSPESLAEQLKLAGCEDRKSLPFHSKLLAGELPYTMGGGIGQSRISMQLLGKAHIGEVQVSLWDPDNHEACEKAGVKLL
ncbi:MAG: aspartate--ammonia ligase [Eubacteriales bacterium]